MEERNYSGIIKHLVFVSGDYPAQGHMMLVFVQQLVHAMIDQGITITVVAPQSIIHSIVHREPLLPRKSQASSLKGLPYYIYRPYILSIGNTRFLRKLLLWYNGVVLSHILDRIKPDTIYAHFWSSAQIVSRYAQRFQIPLFVACGEGDDALEHLVRDCSRRELTQLRCSVTGVISVSSENKRKCIDFNIANTGDIEVFPNCVDISLFRRIDAPEKKRQLGVKDGDFVIAFVGGFISRKGPDRLSEAINKIGDPSIKVMFIGREFTGYPFPFDCSGIIFKGQVNHNDLPIFLNCADIFVLPTRKEGCCNAIVEALAIGLPVVSSNRSFNDDILNDDNSIRVDPDSIDEIATAIVSLKKDPNLRKTMSDYSIKNHNMYSIQGRAHRILDFIYIKITNKYNDMPTNRNL